MERWKEEQAHALLSISNEDELFLTITKMTQELGFEYCAYGIRSPFPISRPKFITFNNYPPKWQTRYRERNYIGIDPTVSHGMRSPLPVIWSDRIFSSTKELWEEARSFGLQVGWAQSSRDANGVGGMLSLARSGEAISQAELRKNELRMSWLSQSCHIGMSAILTHRLMPKINAALSNREIEVLKWTAEGKTSGEISDILNVSERTINFHVANAMDKLNAVNKTAAVILAAMTGMLY